MRLDMTNRTFLKWVDLDRPEMARARALARKRRFAAAAREAARAMFAEALAHPVDEAEIPALAEAIATRWPGQVRHLVRLADNYLLREPGSGLVCGRDREAEHAHYRATAQQRVRRGEGVHVLARLAHLTGERRYRDGAIACLREIVANHEPLPDEPDAGAFDWHPNPSHVGHQPGHTAEKICHALPYLRVSLSPAEALLTAKALLALTEFAFRTCRWDVPSNITLHMLIAPLLVGLLLPAFRPAGEWVRWVRRRLAGDFATRPFATPEGYFGEGFGYQAVNHNLMFMALRYLSAAGRRPSAAMRRISEKGFELAAGMLRGDGKAPLLGDSYSQAVHEHYISAHEILHLAAAWFRRADLKAVAGTPHRETPLEYNVWLMGLGGLAWWDSIDAAPRQRRRARSVHFPRSGLHFLGLGCGVAAHHGMLAAAASHNHAHHDFGSIDLYGLGRALLTDPGVTGDWFVTHSECSHNCAVPVRRRPLGPRLDGADHARTLFVFRRGRVQAACVEHDLYESFRIRRTLCLIDASGDAGGDGDAPALWLVIDRITPAAWPRGRTKSHDYIETYFHFDAPQTHLGRDIESLTCWSRFDPAGCVLRRHHRGDESFAGPSRRVKLADYCRAYEESTSDANLQVTAVIPNRPHYAMDMRFINGVTGQYGGCVRRPSMAFRFAGFLPFDAAYVLVPFRGLRRAACAPVSGRWTRAGALTVTVALPTGKVTLRATGLSAENPKPTFEVRS